MGLTVDYTRISSDKSGEGLGTAAQHGENEELADELSLSIDRTYSDNDRSAKARADGTFAERPDYERMIRDIIAGVISVVIVWHANRLHRNVEEANRFIKIALENGVRLYSVKRGGEYRLTKAAGRADFLRDTVAAQEESEHRGERVALARKRQARTGTYGGGVRPYGWGSPTGRVRRVPVDRKAPAELREYRDVPVLDMTKHNEAEAEEIRRWARDLLSGVSMRQLLRDLEERSVPTQREADGRIIRRDDKPTNHSGWQARSIHQILTSPRVSGHAEYRGEIVKRNAFPEILPEDTRQALIELFRSPDRKTSPGNTPKWLGSLIYRCGVCDDGTTMTVRRANGGDVVYRCKERGHCQRKQADVDGFIQRVIVARLSREDITSMMPKRATVDVRALRERLPELDAKKKKAARMWASDVIDDEQLAEITTEVETERERILTQLKEASAESPLADFIGSDDISRTWEALTLGRKREILRLLATITLMPTGRGTRTFRPDSIRLDWNS